VAPKNEAAEKEVIKDVNSWKDVDLVAATGDLCEFICLKAELAKVEDLLSGLKKPLYAVTGNHDYIYNDNNDRDENGHKVQGTPQLRAVKLKRFRDTLKQPGNYYSRKLGHYLLVFLATDHLTSKRLTTMSDAQVEWFGKTLANNSNVPTIVFFHSPLKGTSRSDLSASFVAQPEAGIKELLLKNKQVLLWVSGHTHTIPGDKDFNAKKNTYLGQVTDIQNGPLARKWTNSLFLYRDRIVVGTYDHNAHKWLPNEQRVFSLGKFAEKEPAAGNGGKDPGETTMGFIKRIVNGIYTKVSSFLGSFW